MLARLKITIGIVFILTAVVLVTILVRLRESSCDTVAGVSNLFVDGVWYEVSSSGKDFMYERTKKIVNIKHDGETDSVETDSIYANEAISDSGLVLGEYDEILPSQDSPVCNGATIEIIRVTKKTVTLNETIAFSIIREEDPNILYGKEVQRIAGHNGAKLLTIEKTYHNEEFIRQEVIKEEITEAPINQIIAVGTKIVVTEIENGVASYYYHPKYPGELIAAHNTYPMGSFVRVTNLRNGKSVIVKIVDRGIKTEGRIIDLSTVAFEQIEERWRGLAQVKVELIAN